MKTECDNVWILFDKYSIEKYWRMKTMYLMFSPHKLHWLKLIPNWILATGFKHAAMGTTEDSETLIKHMLLNAPLAQLVTGDSVLIGYEREHPQKAQQSSLRTGPGSPLSETRCIEDTGSGTFCNTECLQSLCITILPGKRASGLSDWMKTLI